MPSTGTYTKTPVTDPVGGLVQLDRVVVTSTQQYIRFRNIPPGFLDLRINGSFRSNSGNVFDGMNIAFNEDWVAGHYNNYQYVYGTSSNIGAGSGGGGVASSLFMTNYNGGGAPAGYASHGTFEIPNYSNTTFYKAVMFTGHYYQANGGQTTLFWSGGYWISTAAINTIAIFGQNFVAGSTATLYGIGKK
jgi:hypothetical protein